MSYNTVNSSTEFILKLFNDYLDLFSLGVISYSAYILIRYSYYKLKSKKSSLYNSYDSIEFKKKKIIKQKQSLNDIFSDAFMLDNILLSPDNSSVNNKGITVKNILRNDSNTKYINRNLNQIIFHLVNLKRNLVNNSNTQSNLKNILVMLPD